mmetsp:Transcript_41291/g.76299  ORF Transcript_41291/g.76299 Transcript_41291/m.76299 type:complete len:214 (-) Transcript_41291:399-1040(-)
MLEDQRYSKNNRDFSRKTSCHGDGQGANPHCKGSSNSSKMFAQLLLKSTYTCSQIPFHFLLDRVHAYFSSERGLCLNAAFQSFNSIETSAILATVSHLNFEYIVVDSVGAEILADEASYNGTLLCNPCESLDLFWWTIFRRINDAFICKRIRVYCDTFDDWRIDWSICHTLLCPTHNRQPLHLVKYIPSVQHSSKHSVDIVQMRLSLVCDKKL